MLDEVSARHCSRVSDCSSMQEVFGMGKALRSAPFIAVLSIILAFAIYFDNDKVEEKQEETHADTGNREQAFHKLPVLFKHQHMD